MANRKQELDKAVAQSKQEVAEREAPAQAPATQSKLAEFKLPWTQRQEADSAAPVKEKRAVENILVKQEVKEARQKHAKVKSAAQAERRTQVRAKQIETTKSLRTPEVEAKADAATAKFLKRPKKTAPRTIGLAAAVTPPPKKKKKGA
jgi:hypothetical protein